MSGKPCKIKDIFDNLEHWWDYRKMIRMPLYHTCLDFFNEVHAGKTFTDDELVAHPYFQYLLAGWENPDSLAKRTRCMYHMRDGIAVYHSIKRVGMRMPMEVWRDEKRDKLNIHRGLRRLAIKNALGHKRIPVRIYKNRFALEQLQRDPVGTPDDSITGLAVQQMQKYGHNGTDKFWVHDYTELYDAHLGSKRDKYKKVLEIGVFKGASLLLWHDFFTKAHIYGVDMNTSKARMVAGLDRVTLFQGRQGDVDFFKHQVITHSKWDLIVDDCSHKAKDQKETLELLWDSVESGGFYVIEDMYWRGVTDKTARNKLKDMVDLIDDLEVKSVHFYYNIVFVEKR